MAITFPSLKTIKLPTHHNDKTCDEQISKEYFKRIYILVMKYYVNIMLQE